jgi:hypothetical protein
LRSDRFKPLAAEFLVIVLGVSTALAGESLLGRLQDQAAAAAYTERLVQELEEEATALDAIAEAYAQTAEAALRVSAQLESATLVAPPQDLVRDVYLAAQIWLFTASGSTWEDLQSTGRLGLLTSDVRQGLLAYRRRVERYQDVADGLSAEFRERVFRVIPASTQSLLLSECVEHVDLRPVVSDCTELPFVPSADKVAMMLTEDDQLLGDLNLLLPRLEILTGFSANVAQEARELSAALR